MTAVMTEIWGGSKKKSYTMERYNIFNQVHKGLRAFLYDTALLVQQTDFLHTDEAIVSLERINDTLHHFIQHALYVERFLFPFIREYNPVLTNTIKQQYQANIMLAQRLRGFMTVYDHAVSSADKTETGRALSKSFTGFLVANLDYMNREDSLINNTLWRYYNDAELRGLEKEIVLNLPQKDLAVYTKWMIRGMSNTEIIQWLRAQEKSTETCIFRSFFVTAEKELPEYRWQQIQEALAEGSFMK
jgi:hypothetical protein